MRWEYNFFLVKENIWLYSIIFVICILVVRKLFSYLVLKIEIEFIYQKISFYKLSVHKVVQPSLPINSRTFLSPQKEASFSLAVTLSHSLVLLLPSPSWSIIFTFCHGIACNRHNIYIWPILSSVSDLACFPIHPFYSIDR